MQKVIACLTLLATLSVARRDPLAMYRNEHILESPELEQNFTNKVNHFDIRSSELTYQQRYWVNDTYFDKAEGPVFLYICGEWTCSPESIDSYPFMVGRENNANLISLEHRYYGKSQPFADWSTHNLEFLTSEQALADIAAFIDAKNIEF